MAHPRLTTSTFQGRKRIYGALGCIGFLMYCISPERIRAIWCMLWRRFVMTLIACYSYAHYFHCLGWSASCVIWTLVCLRPWLTLNQRYVLMEISENKGVSVTAQEEFNKGEFCITSVRVATGGSGSWSPCWRWVQIWSLALRTLGHCE